VATDTGNTIKITDKDGVKSFDVNNGINGVDGANGADGVNGVDGADGFSPVVTVTEIEGGNKVSIEDLSGIKSFEVLNGKDGEDAEVSQYGLVTNAQNFKIDITKNNAYWYGMFTFSFVYGTTPCEITVTITDKVYYTITKGQNVVSAITYAQDGANYTIGIDFTAKIYGTQVVNMPTEFGVVNSFTDETYAGNTTAIYQGSYSMKSYVALSELGLDTTATINDIIGAMKDGSQITYKTDVFDYATEYNNIQYGTVTIHKQSASRVQALMTDKDTGNLYIGRLDSNNKVIGWRKILTEKSDPYACDSYTVLTGTEDLFTLPCGHYVSANINTTYNYPITDSSNATAHIYVLGHLNDSANNKGYRIILYFDNKGRMYNINEWWGSFSNGWKEIATKEYVDSKIADLQAQINALKS